ncbi:MAG: hypothetical protein Q6373_022310 [Candidatus Sigynarchaeota archaeon]
MTSRSESLQKNARGAQKRIMMAMKSPKKMMASNTMAVAALSCRNTAFEPRAWIGSGIAMQVENFYDGGQRVGKEIIGGAPGWSVVGFIPTGMAYVPTTTNRLVPRVEGALVVERAAWTTPAGVTHGATQYTLKVLIDLETRETCIEEKNDPYHSPSLKIVPKLFGDRLRGVVEAVIDASMAGGSWAIDSVSVPQAITSKDMLDIVLKDQANPSSTLTIKFGNKGPMYESGSGAFAVVWEIAGRNAIELNVGARDTNVSPWTKPSMIRKILPELTHLAAWLEQKDGGATKTLLLAAAGSEQLKLAGAPSFNSQWVGVEIYDDNDKTKHVWIAFDTSQTYPPPNADRLKVYCKTVKAGDWGKYKDFWKDNNKVTHVVYELIDALEALGRGR